MTTPLLLVSTALLITRPADGQPAVMAEPRLSPGQELLYRGTYRESNAGSGLPYERSYFLESRVFVLGKSTRGFPVALFTVLRPLGPHAGGGSETDAVSVRLELAFVTRQGRLEPQPGDSLIVPVAGPPSVESGAFVELPTGRLDLRQTWRTEEPGRPSVSWQAAGFEPIAGFTCLRLEAVQQTPGWDRPGGDQTAWRRRETVWLSPDLGVARRVERILEQRLPGQRQGLSSRLAYDRQSALHYPGQLFEDRRREIAEAQSLSTALAPGLADPGRCGPEFYDGLLARIARHLQSRPATPYREAILQVQRRVEAVRRGETPPSPWP